MVEDPFKAPLANVDGKLFIDNVSTLRLAAEFDTPLYVISETKIRENYSRLKSALQNIYRHVRILYSAKANTNLSVLKILESEGSDLDVVSPGEVFLALKAGFTPDRIFFTGTSVRDDELAFLLEAGILINVDSLSQLRRLLKLRAPEALSVRINPGQGAGHHEHVITGGIESKYGIWENDAVEAYRIMKAAGVSRFGIQMHIGSGISSVNPYLSAMEELLKIAKTVHDEVKIDFDFIDLGGGIGVPYKPEEKEKDIEGFTREICRFFKSRIEEYDLGRPEIWFEPGRYLVAEAGILLTRVNTIKSTPFRIFAGVDAGFNTLIRPILYGSYHHIVVANNLNAPSERAYDIAGPICESGDVFARERSLPKLSEGDLLAIMNAGAYGFSMSSQYNSRPRTAEILVNNGLYEIIRERETFDDLLEKQRIPSWLNGNAPTHAFNHLAGPIKTFPAESVTQGKG